MYEGQYHFAHHTREMELLKTLLFNFYGDKGIVDAIKGEHNHFIPQRLCCRIKNFTYMLYNNIDIKLVIDGKRPLACHPSSASPFAPHSLSFIPASNELSHWPHFHWTASPNLLCSLSYLAQRHSTIYSSFNHIMFLSVCCLSAASN